MANQARALAATTVLADYLALAPSDHLWCFTDSGRAWFAAALAEQARRIGSAATIVDLSSGGETPESVLATLRGLSESNVVIAAFSHGAVASRYAAVFPSFRRPDGFAGRSAIIRQHYPDDALLTHLTTPLASASAAAARALAIRAPGRVRLTAPGGTDLSCELRPAIILPFRPDDARRHVYLPPAEVTFGIAPESASGIIVADVTCGEVVVKGETYDTLGVVDAPVCITVTNGRATALSGGETASRLAACFDRLDHEQPSGSDGRLVVELGFGLSLGIPVGQGAPDECLQGTCHFGIGNDFFYGGANAVPMHMDVVVRGPVTVVPE